MMLLLAIAALCVVRVAFVATRTYYREPALYVLTGDDRRRLYVVWTKLDGSPLCRRSDWYREVRPAMFRGRHVKGWYRGSGRWKALDGAVSERGQWPFRTLQRGRAVPGPMRRQLRLRVMAEKL